MKAATTKRVRKPGEVLTVPAGFTEIRHVCYGGEPYDALKAVKAGKLVVLSLVYGGTFCPDCGAMWRRAKAAR
jgi:hypothetical protein